MGLNGAAPTRGSRDSSSGCLGEAASQSVCFEQDTVIQCFPVTDRPTNLHSFLKVLKLKCIKKIR